MHRKDIDLLADVYECLQEVRELADSPPLGYSDDETLFKLQAILGGLAEDADKLQQELAITWEAVLDTVEARMAGQIGG